MFTLEPRQWNAEGFLSGKFPQKPRTLLGKATLIEKDDNLMVFPNHETWPNLYELYQKKTKFQMCTWNGKQWFLICSVWTIACSTPERLTHLHYDPSDKHNGVSITSPQPFRLKDSKPIKLVLNKYMDGYIGLSPGLRSVWKISHISVQNGNSQ